MKLTSLKQILAVAWVSFTLPGCLTLVDDPGRFRESKNLTVGYPGVLVTTAHTGFGMSLAEPEKATRSIYSGRDGGDSYSINPDAQSEDIRHIHSDSWGANFLALHFPWRSSFFFYGFALEVKRARNAYNERTESFALDESVTNVEWTDTTVNAAIPLGISINYDEQLTFTSGIGPKFLLSNSRHYVDDGGDDEVDVAMRDATLDSYGSYQKQSGFFLYYQLGYSF